MALADAGNHQRLDGRPARLKPTGFPDLGGTGTFAARCLSRIQGVSVMGRVALVAACWFAFWMTLGSVVGGLTGGVSNGIYFGAFNGAWWAVLTSFAWPWIMPEAIERWMDRREEPQ
jgi:hypothetical protein